MLLCVLIGRLHRPPTLLCVIRARTVRGRWWVHRGEFRVWIGGDQPTGGWSSIQAMNSAYLQADRFGVLEAVLNPQRMREVKR